MRRPTGAPGQGWDPGSPASVLRSRAPSSRWSVRTELGGFFRSLPCFPILLCCVSSPRPLPASEVAPRPLSTVLSPAGPARSALPRHLDPCLPETLLTEASAPQTPPRPHPVSQKTSSALRSTCVHSRTSATPSVSENVLSSAFHVCPQQDLNLQLPCLTFALVQAVMGSHADKRRIVSTAARVTSGHSRCMSRDPRGLHQLSLRAPSLPRPGRTLPCMPPPRPPHTRSAPPPGHPDVPRCLCTASALLFAELLPGPRPPHLHSRGPP